MSSVRTPLRFRWPLLLLPLCGLAGCSDDFSLGRQLWQDTFVQSASVSVDVLFVVDNSGSMQNEQALIIEAFDQFIANIEESNTNFHIGVTTTDMGEDGAQGRLIEYEVGNDGYRYITAGMSSDLYSEVFAGMIGNLGLQGTAREKGLWAGKAALYPVSEGGFSGAGGYNEGFLREEAKLAVIFVTDEDDCSDEDAPLPEGDQGVCYSMYDQLRPVYEYVSDYQVLKNQDDDIVVSAIVGPAQAESGSECDEATTPGWRYIELVNEFHGVIGDLCQSDFAEILDRMGLSAAGIQTRFVLSRTPTVDTLEVSIDDTFIPATEGWNYDAEDNAVVFFGEVIPSRDSTITITYFPSK